MARYPESSWEIIDQELFVLLVATESVRSFNPNFESKFDARTYSGAGQRSSSFRGPSPNSFRSELQKSGKKCWRFNTVHADLSINVQNATHHTPQSYVGINTP